MVATLVSTFKDMKTDVKNMSESVVAMNLKLEIVITKHDNTAKVAEDNNNSILKIRDRLHSLEGQNDQVLLFITEYAKTK